MLLAPRLLAALALAGALTAPALAQGPWSPEAVRQAQARALERSLQQRLERLPGITGARAHVQLPDPLARGIDSPAEPPHVALSLQPAVAHARSSLTPTAVELALSEVPGARPSEVTVRWLTEPAPAAPEAVHVGPFRVEPSSARGLRATLLALLATAFGLSALLLRYTRRG